jgi:dihydrofolate reductase
MITMIVAADEKDAIGRGGTLPWYLPEDLKRFRRLTTGHTVVSGRRNHEDIVRRLGHPLPDRTTVVLTRQPSLVDESGVHYVHSLADAIKPGVFIIGGAEVYRAALPYVRKIELTRVFGDHEGDIRLDPGWLDGFRLINEEPPAAEYQWQTYERI